MEKNTNNNLALYDRVRVVPQEAKKEIKGGRIAGMTDINPMWRIKTLTSEFGQCGIGWYYDIVEQTTLSAPNGEVKAFVTIKLYTATTDGWSAPIMGVGGSSFVSQEKNGTYVNDECFKMALTDAISVSAKALGIGADVFFSKDSSKYDNAPTQPPAQVQSPTPEDPDLLIALDDVKKTRDVDHLKEIWDGWKTYQGNDAFKVAVNNRKFQLSRPQ